MDASFCRRIIIVATLVLGAISDAAAVALGARGTGQVLLFPYYTVNAGYDTMLTIVNGTGDAKAVRVRFVEGENGREALSLNLYLAPLDNWTAVLTAATRGGTSPIASAVLRTRDRSCTLPAMGQVDASTATGLDLANASFSGAREDPGGPSMERVREGMIEVIEMGVVSDELLWSATTAGGAECRTLEHAWTAGVWSHEPDAGLRSPNGGLAGSALIIDVADGVLFGYPATALEAFREDPNEAGSNVVLHTRPGDERPHLGDAISDPAQGVATATIATVHGQVAASWPAPAQAIDAVSAVLMAGTLTAGFTTNPDIAAATSHVLAYPTRRYYTDPALVESPVAPFSWLYAGVQQGRVTEAMPYATRGPEDAPRPVECYTDACRDRLQLPGTSVEVLDLAAGADSVFHSLLAARFAATSDSPASYTDSGVVMFAPDLSLLGIVYSSGLPPLRYMRPSIEGFRFAGLPVIGFSAQVFSNGTAQSSYATAIQMGAQVSCWVSVGEFAETCTNP